MPKRIDERTSGRLERVAPRALKLFAGPGGGIQESGRQQESLVNSGPPNKDDIEAISTQIKRTTVSDKAVAGRDPGVEADAIAAQLVARATDVLERLRGGAHAGELSADGAYALEAVLCVRGRPALRVEGNSIEPIDDLKHPGSEFWKVFRDEHEDNLVKVAGATGAVMVKDRMGLRTAWVQGTAWLIKPDLVMTNRHVLLPSLGLTRLVRRVPGAATTARFKSDLDVSIDFTFDNRPVGQPVACSALDVLYVSEDDDPIDVAVIRIAPPANATVPLPAPLVMASVPRDYQYIYVIGHPGRMPEVPEKVRAVFGTPDERKRVSFGETMDADAARPNEIVYDSSTIGGFSGGCVLPFLTDQVIGLHHYGDPLSGNRAFAAEALRAHAVARFL